MSGGTGGGAKNSNPAMTTRALGGEEKETLNINVVGKIIKINSPGFEYMFSDMRNSKMTTPSRQTPKNDPTNTNNFEKWGALAPIF